MKIEYTGKIKQDGVVTFIYPDGKVEDLEMYLRDVIGEHKVFNGKIAVEVLEEGDKNND